MNAALHPPSNMPGSREDCLVELDGITKSFSGVRVLNDVTFRLRAGEVHALMGENGAGKSTLMKVLAGIHSPDGGEVRLDGRALRLGSPHAALRAGIAMIYQELLPFLDLSVAENILMGQEPVNRLGWVQKEAMARRAEALLSRLGVGLSPQRIMRSLSVAEMQTVEIAKALAHRARVIIMDEPTSALSEREAEALFRIIADLREQGTAVIYISHKLEEVFRLADRMTVLRDGNLVGTYPAREMTRDRLIALMVGSVRQTKLPGAVPRERRQGVEVRTAKGEVALSVRGLGKLGRFKNITFDVREGEVLGLAGLMGAGRTDVVNALYGLDPADSGTICVRKRPVRIRSPRDALQAGIGLVTENRKLFGIVPTLGVQQNLTLAALHRWCRHGFIDGAAEAGVADQQIRAFAIRAAGKRQLADRLSGGNQQKVVFARTLLAQPDILLLDEPTRGIDIAAKSEVHALIAQWVRSGKAVVLVSSELPELLALSDRILVMCEGELTAELKARVTTPEEILKFAMPQ